MRIRKHAKISPLLYATSSLDPRALLQTHVCQLNQSPWDAMKFSPPPPTPPHPPPLQPHQADGDGVSDAYGSSDRRGSAPGREEDQQFEHEDSDDISEEPKFDTTFCCKTDGKSWRCRKEPAVGSTLCEHHLSQAKSYSSSLSQQAPKKPGKMAARRAQAKKASAAAAKASNPYEFYYYSGFGPRWGKKRGENSNENSSMKKIVEREPEPEDDEIDRAVPASRNDSDLDECDEDEEERINRGNMGKKRVRKPIKARSLKSLM